MINNIVTSLRTLVRDSWGKPSNFLLGIEYQGTKGDIWTSLSLRIAISNPDSRNILSEKCEIPQLFESIPGWVDSIFKQEDVHISFDKIAKRDQLDFIYIGPTITRREFCFLFSNACLRNSNIFFYSSHIPLTETAASVINMHSGQLFIIKREVFDQWIDQIHEKPA